MFRPNFIEQSIKTIKISNLKFSLNIQKPRVQLVSFKYVIVTNSSTYLKIIDYKF